MLITCPSCDARYTVPASFIGAQGRETRCSACGHSWFQGPDPDEVLKILDTMPPDSSQPSIAPADNMSHAQNFDVPIPDGVKPMQDDHAPYQRKSLSPRQALDPRLQAMLVRGVLLPLAIFVLIIVGLSLVRQSIVTLWPGSVALYDLLGQSVSLPGQGLTIDQVKTEIHDGKLAITGTIINLTDKQQDIPKMEGRIVKVNGPEDEPALAQWLIDPPHPTIGAEETLPFTLTYPLDKAVIDTKDKLHIILRFILLEPLITAPHINPAEDDAATHE